MTTLPALKVDLSTKEGREHEVDLLREELNASALSDHGHPPCPHGGACECPKEKARLGFSDSACISWAKCPPRAIVCPDGIFFQKP